MNEAEQSVWLAAYSAFIRSRATHQIAGIGTDAENAARQAVVAFRRAMKEFA